MWMGNIIYQQFYYLHKHLDFHTPVHQEQNPLGMLANMTSHYVHELIYNFCNFMDQDIYIYLVKFWT